MGVKNRRIPSVTVGGVSLPRLILGHLPFVGESYQGAERNQEYVTRFTHVENTVMVLAKAINEYGVTALAVDSAVERRLSHLLLDAVRKVGATAWTELSLLPCFSIPLTLDGEALDDYRRWLTYYMIERRVRRDGLLAKYVRDPILLCRPGWATRFPAALTHASPYRADEIARLQLNYAQLDRALTAFKEFRLLFAQAGSESDFLTMTGRHDLLEDFVHFLAQELHCPVLLGLHHAGISIPRLDAMDVGVVGYVTPVNSLGALMLPSHHRALRAIKASGKPVIAIKPLAGGRVPPRTAFDYVFTQVGVAASMLGVASEPEVDEDFRLALKALSGL
jgi:hypothetical protein